MQDTEIEIENTDKQEITHMGCKHERIVRKQVQLLLAMLKLEKDQKHKAEL